ncbi:hypothetical protein TIFTF001_012398 [Ficus carica]|uniref:Uncharacterized protein n=1 Tax=Ficus carica TaxID=3494 RepID=A0AA88A1M0_FICCA|nr:hypothetical protein TIFTF001_012398 [Ficus carica]
MASRVRRRHTGDGAGGFGATIPETNLRRGEWGAWVRHAGGERDGGDLVRIFVEGPRFVVRCVGWGGSGLNVGGRGGTCVHHAGGWSGQSMTRRAIGRIVALMDRAQENVVPEEFEPDPDEINGILELPKLDRFS